MKSILKKKILLLIACIFIISCYSKSQNKKIDEFMTEMKTTNKFSGAAIAVIKDHKLLYSANYGFADLHKKIPISDSTQFNIMSISKIFIACAIVQLADKKMIGLDDPIRKYLHQLPSTYDKVLIYQLLNHSSGIPDYVHVTGYMTQANKYQSPYQVLDPILNKPLNFIPGDKSQYSNSGYFLLGLIIEKVSGISLGEYLKTTFFDPLGMKNTYLDNSAFKNKIRAKGYTTVNGQLRLETNLDPSQYWAAGGIVSNKVDMIIWNEALTSGKVLPQKVINYMIKPSLLNNGINGDYGLGFEIMNDPNMKIAGNNGAGRGFNAANISFLNDELTVLVLTNTSNSNSSMIAKSIRDIIYNTSLDKSTSSIDKLDSLVIIVFQDIEKDALNQKYFIDSNAFDNFQNQSSNFIKSQGMIKSLDRQGEKINPETVIRRYKIRFQKNEIIWVLIFNHNGKIIIANHM